MAIIKRASNIIKKADNTYTTQSKNHTHYSDKITIESWEDDFTVRSGKKTIITGNKS